MNRGKILRVRPGHDANCSAMSYIGEVVVSYVGYGAFLLALVGIQVALQTKRLAAKPWIDWLKIVSWVIPHLVAMAVLWIWASGTGMMGYGSAACVGVLELAMLISLGVGWARITAKPRAARKAAGILCPNCGRQVGSRSAWSCPKCGFDLAAARLVLLAGRDAVGTCPNCGEAVAATAENCPSCRIDLAWAREHLDELAGE